MASELEGVWLDNGVCLCPSSVCFADAANLIIYYKARAVFSTGPLLDIKRALCSVPELYEITSWAYLISC